MNCSIRRERKKLKVHANEGQCDNVAEMFMACSYMIDGDYMFGVTVGPVARVLEALKVPGGRARGWGVQARNSIRSFARLLMEGMLLRLLRDINVHVMCARFFWAVVLLRIVFDKKYVMKAK